MEPSTPAEVFDMIHGLFGIGDYSEDDPDPWHRFRMVEISKIKAIQKKRRWTCAEFASAARYCHRHGITITKTWDLLPFHGQAAIEDIQNARLRKEAALQEAVALERSVGWDDSSEWANRLELSSGRGREELLEEWRETRQRALEAEWL